jgi:sterol 3beta-glucosyltransferase
MSDSRLLSCSQRPRYAYQGHLAKESCSEAHSPAFSSHLPPFPSSFTSHQMLIPTTDIIGLQNAKASRFSHHGLALVLRGHEELFLEFSSTQRRDACRRAIDRQLEESSANARLRAKSKSTLTASSGEKNKVEEEGGEGGGQGGRRESTSAEREAELLEKLDAAKINQPGQRPTPPSAVDDGAPNPGVLPPVMFTSGEASLLDFKPKEQMHITCLTIGSRGDVQPCTFLSTLSLVVFSSHRSSRPLLTKNSSSDDQLVDIALCKGLQAEGHTVRIASHGEYKDWIEGHGIEFGYVGGDPAELMRICVENGMFTVSFIKEGLQKVRLLFPPFAASRVM